MFWAKYGKGFFKRKAVVVTFAILFVAGLLYHSGFLGGEDKRIRVTCVGDSLTYGSGVLKTPDKMTSWDFFDYLLEKVQIVGTPGAGFGPSGEGYFRLTAFGSAENTLRAIERIKNI